MNKSLAEKRISRVRVASLTLLLSTSLQTGVFALTSGPSMPEYTNFEPLDSPDMVDLSRGTFAYLLPLMSVPGPGLGFPITLNYHAGIGVEQEASWVGLGWNVEAGAISRQVNNIPDDYNGDQIVESIVGKRDHGRGFSVSTAFGYVGATWRNGEMVHGSIGYSFGNRESPWGVNLGLNYSKEDGIGASASPSYKSKSGFVMGGEIGLNGSGATVGASAHYSGTGLSGEISSNNSGAISASLVGQGVTLHSWGRKSGNVGMSYSKNFSGAVKDYVKNIDNGFMIPTTFGPIFLGWKGWDIRHSGYSDDSYYGFLYADAASMGCTPGNPCHLPDDAKKMELNTSHQPVWNSAGDYSFFAATAEDAYSVQTQGLSGMIKPYRTEDGDYMDYLSNTELTSVGPHFFDFPGGVVLSMLNDISCALFDWLCDENTITIDYAPLFQAGDFSPTPTDDWRNLHVTGIDNIQWRFVGETGGGLYTNPDGSRDALHEVSAGSQRIIPLFQTGNSGKLAGWEIFKEDGVRYLYTRALNNNSQTQELSDAEGNKTTQTQNTSYAYTWLLTAILNPDHVFMGSGHSCSDFKVASTTKSICLPKQGDLGGWVRFDYTMNANYGWGFQGRNGVMGNLETSDIKIDGIKEIAYLEKIVTPTHKAIFGLAQRLDGRGAGAIPSRLKHITLYNNDQDEALSRVEFIHDYSLSPQTENSVAFNKGKLTLKGVKQVSGSNGPSFIQNEFSYEFNPAWDRSKKDYWGFYCDQCGESSKEPRSDNTTRAWSLTKIVDVMGKVMEIKYQSNSIDYIGNRPLVFPPGTDYTTENLYRNYTSSNVGNTSFSRSHIREEGSALQPYFAMPLAELEGPQLFNLDHVKNIPHPTPVKYFIESGASQSYGTNVSNLYIVSNTDQLKPEKNYEDFYAGNASAWRSDRQDEYNSALRYNGIQLLDALPIGVWYGKYDIDDNLFGGPTGCVGNLFEKCRVSTIRLPMSDAFIRIWALYSTSPSWSKPGGGIRVAELKTSDPISGYANTVEYTYTGGSTAVMPSSESYYSLDFAAGDGNGQKKFSGFPAVFYKRTEVKFKDLTDWGREVYSFVTPHDAPITHSVSEPSLSGVDSRIKILDLSAFWGQLWRKSTINKDNQEVASMQLAWGHDWTFEPSLAKVISVDGVALNTMGIDVTPDGSKFGVTQTIYSHRHLDVGADQKLCYPYVNNQVYKECLSTNGIHTSQVVQYKVNPYLRYTINTQDKVTEATESRYFDYLTGVPLISIEKNTIREKNATTGAIEDKEKSFVTYSQPAYKVYDAAGEMKDKNMLTQVFSTTIFEHVGEISAYTFSQLTDATKVVSSTFTKWFDSEKGKWRKKEAFSLNQRAGFELPTRNTAAGNLWRSEGVSRFDDFGHEVEFEDNLGRKTATVFGQGHSLQTAVIQNGGVEGTFYESFEHLGDMKGKAGVFLYVNQKDFNQMSETERSAVHGVRTFYHAKTGANALRVRNNGGIEPGKGCFNVQYPYRAGQSYSISAWYWDDAMASGAKPQISVSNGTDPGIPVYSAIAPATGTNTWRRLEWEHTFTNEGATSSNICLHAGSGVAGPDVLFDEVRVRPKAGHMSTFSYNYSGNMTSASDANEVVTHFQYDAFGNMSGLRREDGPIVSEQAKKYTRTGYTIAFPDRDPTEALNCAEPAVIGDDGKAKVVDYQVLATSDATIAQMDATNNRNVCTQDKGGTALITVQTAEGELDLPVKVRGTQLGFGVINCTGYTANGTRCGMNFSAVKNRVNLRDAANVSSWVLHFTFEKVSEPGNYDALCFDGFGDGFTGLPGDDTQTMCDENPRQNAHLRFTDMSEQMISRTLPKPSPTMPPLTGIPPGLQTDRLLKSGVLVYSLLRPDDIFTSDDNTAITNFTNFKNHLDGRNLTIKKAVALSNSEFDLQEVEVNYTIYYNPGSGGGGPNFYNACINGNCFPDESIAGRKVTIRAEAFGP